jgi:asparaginyl-tRNA synthetase
MATTTSINRIGTFVGQEVELRGWMYNKRSSGKIHFLQLRDGSGFIQGVVVKGEVSEEVFARCDEINLESSVSISGVVREDKRAPSGFELTVTDLKVVTLAPDDYPIGKKEHGPDFLLSNRHLWLRSKRQWAILKIRDQIYYTVMQFLREQDFTRIDAPILQPTSCEDTSELFQIDFFGEPVYLTQSGQLYIEAAEMSLGRVYDFGPVFRAEKSKTRKHLNEFWMMDAELPFTSLEGMMDFIEALIKRIAQDCLRERQQELLLLERDQKPLEHVRDAGFKRIKHKEIVALLNEKKQAGLSLLDDIGAPEEEMIAELFDVPLFITDWPAQIKAFYMPHFQDGELERVRACDLICTEGYGEIVGGAEREYDYDKLKAVMEKRKYKLEDYAWYLDLRKYGGIPHSGFGIGLERIVAWICGLEHIRESIPFPRMLNRIRP